MKNESGGGTMRVLISTLVWVMMTTIVVAQTIIKFATVAPEGSTWMNVMTEFSQAVSTQTNGEIKFKLYPGSQSGDELVVLRKIRIGQLHSAGFTGVALGEILPEVRILDSPFLFRSYAEVDYITSKLFDYFSTKFEEKGFILLGWAEVGFVYVFTTKPVYGVQDLSGVKMWMWEGDPVAEATFKSIDISPIPLSITDVLTSLQTNLINGVYISPLACIALQWYSKLKYMLELPLADANGAVLLVKSQYDKLETGQQEILRNLARQYFGKLTALSRENNAQSLEIIKKAGIQFTQVKDKAEIEKYYQAGKAARRMLIGKLYDENFLNQVETELAEFRKQNPTPAGP
jgi:TRAP-type C4-dicarboxylate transport system substrate-binding protein